MTVLSFLMGASVVAIVGGMLGREHFRTSKQNTEALGAQVQSLTEDNTQLRELLEQDTLTVAKSRQYLTQRIDDSARTKDYALLFVDIDKFKSVNDGHGHDIGDALLQEIAIKITAHLGPDDFIARLGGDEFAVILGNPDIANAMIVGNTLLSAVTEAKVNSGDLKVSRSASIGVGTLPRHRRLIDALIIADGALRRAKAQGGYRVQLADASVLRSIAKQRARPSVEQLQTGLEKGEVVYHVQPIFNLRSGVATGVEALIRWVMPDGTVRQPEDFLDTMTQNYHMRLNPPLQAANETAQKFAGIHGQMFCAFNISSSFLERTEEIDSAWINRLLNGIPPHQLVFEIVESAVIADPKGAHRMVSALRDAGLRVALDDFGTGQSNLQRLREYPVDIVKIDRQFVQSLASDPRNSGILLGLMEMSHTVGFDIIAEGVETEEQLEVVEALGIELAQGYHLGRPDSIDVWHQRLSTQLAYVPNSKVSIA